MWVNYESYTNGYLLGRKPIIPEVEFPFWSRKAESYINKRNVILDEVTEPLIICVCEVAELVFLQEQKTDTETGIKVVKSFSNDGYSESYDTNLLSKSELINSIVEIVVRNLAGTIYHNDFVFSGV